MSSKFKVPATFTVPDTIEGVKSLLTARKWDKAAIVWAYVHCEEMGGKQPNRRKLAHSKPYTTSTFAALDIAGLRSKDTVRVYWQAWQDKIDSGEGCPIGPGDTITYPEHWPWPPIRHDWTGTGSMDAAYEEAADEYGVSPAMAKRAASNSDAVKAAILANPKIAEAAEDALAERLVKEAQEAQLEAIQRGGKVTTVDRKPKAKDMWPDVAEEVGRAEPIHELRRLVEELHTKADLILANGDPQNREAEFLAPVVKEIGEIYWSLSKLVVKVDQ